ncbi:unnamed protein product [Pleuronectes platessa]|uniref:Uncharacterized protein n=1 Tax=Pleuronectes platessa TaxID=8262 RepID=A0A9N7V7H4_PLEPL|nr:unnamed protein product [Pleuronectes platessa]
MTTHGWAELAWIREEEAGLRGGEVERLLHVQLDTNVAVTRGGRAYLGPRPLPRPRALASGAGRQMPCRPPATQQMEVKAFSMTNSPLAHLDPIRAFGRDQWEGMSHDDEDEIVTVAMKISDAVRASEGNL